MRLFIENVSLDGEENNHRGELISSVKIIEVDDETTLRELYIITDCVEKNKPTNVLIHENSDIILTCCNVKLKNTIIHDGDTIRRKYNDAQIAAYKTYFEDTKIKRFSDGETQTDFSLSECVKTVLRDGYTLQFVKSEKK